MWNKIFFRDLSNFNFRKKKEMKKNREKKEERAQFVINYHTPSCGLPFVSRREISDIILIIRRNISSNGYNQYY